MSDDMAFAEQLLLLGSGGVLTLGSSLLTSWISGRREKRARADAKLDQRADRGREHLRRCYDEVTLMFDALGYKGTTGKFNERDSVSRLSKEAGLIPDDRTRAVLEGLVWVMFNRSYFEGRDPRYGKFEDRGVLAAGRRITASQLRGDEFPEQDAEVILRYVEDLEYLERSYAD